MIHPSQLANDLTNTGERDPDTNEPLRPQGARALTPDEAVALAEYVNWLERRSASLEQVRLCAVTMLADPHGPELNRSHKGMHSSLFDKVRDKLTEQQNAFLETLEDLERIEDAEGAIANARVAQSERLAEEAAEVARRFERQ